MLQHIFLSVMIFFASTLFPTIVLSQDDKPHHLGVFDGLGEVIRNNEINPLSENEYDVSYNSKDNVNTIKIDIEKYGRSYALLQKKVNESISFKTTISFSPIKDAAHRTRVFLGDDINHIGSTCYYFGTDQVKRNSIMLSKNNSFWSVAYNIIPYSDKPEDEMHYRLTYYADLQVGVSEWSVNGEKWFSKIYPVFYGDEFNAVVVFETSQSLEFQLKNTAIQTVNHTYGRRKITKLDDQTAKVTIELFHPNPQKNELIITENIEGDFEVSNISSNGKLKEIGDAIDLRQIIWKIPGNSDITQLEYMIKKNNNANLALFNGKIQDQVIVGKGDYTFIDYEEKIETIKHIRTWTASEGLPDSSIRYLNVGPNDSVYTMSYNPRTKATLLNVFDGYDFNSILLPEKLKDGFVKEAFDGSLWYYQEWNLYHFNEDQSGQYTWELCKTTNGKSLQVTDRITPSFLHCGDPTMGGNTAKYRFIPIDVECIYCLTNDQLKLYNSITEEETILLEANSTSLGSFIHMLLSNDNNLWITGERGVIKVNPYDKENQILMEHVVSQESSLYDFDLPIENNQGNLLVRGGHSYITPCTYLINLNQKFQPMGLGFGAPISFSNDNSVWMLSEADDYQSMETIAKFKSDIKFILPQDTGQLTYRTADFDNESDDVFWLGSDFGLLRYSPPLWRKPESIKEIHNEISMITEDSAGNIWILDKEHLVKIYGNECKKYQKPRSFSFWKYKAQSMVILPDGRLAINVGETAINPKPFCVFDPTTETFDFVYHPEDIHCDYIAPGKHHNLLMVMFDPEFNTRLVSYDNDQFTTLVEEQELLKLGIYCIYERDNGDILIGSDSEEHLQWYRDGKKLTFTGEKAYPGYTAFSILEVDDHKIWVGDNNNLYEFDGVRWSVIRSNTNMIISMIKASDESIWVASWTGLHQYKNGTWITYSVKDGFSNNFINKIFEDSQNRLWVGAADGVYLYHPDADPDPPQTFLDQTENLNDFSYNGEVRISFSAIDKWKYTEKEHLLYSYRLNQEPWTPFTEQAFAIYRQLKPGNYTIQVRSMDRNWNIDPTPATFDFLVNHVPIQERDWFVPLIAGTIGLILLLALLTLVSRFKLACFAQNLERMVEEKTKQLSKTEGHLLQVSEYEQQRIGQDLHDDVVQDLIGIALSSELLIKGLRPVAPQKVIEVEEILHQVDLATNKTRSLAKGLSPVNLDQLGLLGALQRLSVGIEELYSTNCKIKCDANLQALHHNQKLNLYRIAQEAANNAAKHAHAALVEIIIQQKNGTIILAIQDNGYGFDAQAKSEGMGLQILYYRARDIQAELSIDSKPGQGTKVTCIMPLDNTKESELSKSEFEAQNFVGNLSTTKGVKPLQTSQEFSLE